MNLYILKSCKGDGYLKIKYRPLRFELVQNPYKATYWEHKESAEVMLNEIAGAYVVDFNKELEIWKFKERTRKKFWKIINNSKLKLEFDNENRKKLQEALEKSFKDYYFG